MDEPPGYSTQRYKEVIVTVPLEEFRIIFVGILPRSINYLEYERFRQIIADTILVLADRSHEISREALLTDLRVKFGSSGKAQTQSPVFDKVDVHIKKWRMKSFSRPSKKKKSAGKAKKRH